MATLTRSSRRVDQLNPHHAVGRPKPNANAHLIATTGARANANAAQNSIAFPPNPPTARSNNKRPLDTSDYEDYDAFNRKKAKISADLYARTPSAAARAAEPAVATSNDAAPHRSQHRLKHPPPHAPAPAPCKTTSQNYAKPQPPTSETPARHLNQPSQNTGEKLTKHQEKVRNGLQHELDRLQPAASDTKPGGRKLRSQESSRYKSELAAYFPDYDEVIGNEAKEHHLLTTDIPVVVASHSPNIDTHTTSTPYSKSTTPHSSRDSISSLRQDAYPTLLYGDPLFEKIHDSQRIDFGFLEKRFKGKSLDDALADSYFESAHKKAERAEKTVRNAEKGRAQHERDRIVRLLDGLLGHDWLRVMGVSGITEGRKKTFEPARDHFIKGCRAILDKFRRWSEEEKRRKQERERAALGREQSAQDAAASSSSAESPPGEDEDDGHTDASSTNDHLSDVDASIERQLQEEVLARSRVASDTSAAQSTSAKNTGGPSKQTVTKRRGGKATAKPPPPKRKMAEQEKEFTSFFKKKHERDAALQRGRRTGRRVLAWGEPVPDFPEAEFDLPEDMKDAEILQAVARKKRQAKRAARG